MVNHEVKRQGLTHPIHVAKMKDHVKAKMRTRGLRRGLQKQEAGCTRQVRDVVATKQCRTLNLLLVHPAHRTSRNLVILVLISS